MVRSIKNTFTPINRVPPDILSLIPGHCLMVDRELIALTHVCWSLQEIFISCTSLWTFLDCTNLNKTNTYIQRFQKAPLEIHFIFHEDAHCGLNVLRLMVPHIGWIKALMLSGFSDDLDIHKLAEDFGFQCPFSRNWPSLSMMTSPSGPSSLIEAPCYCANYIWSGPSSTCPGRIWWTLWLSTSAPFWLTAYPQFSCSTFWMCASPPQYQTIQFSPRLLQRPHQVSTIPPSPKVARNPHPTSALSPPESSPYTIRHISGVGIHVQWREIPNPGLPPQVPQQLQQYLSHSLYQSHLQFWGSYATQWHKWTFPCGRDPNLFRPHHSHGWYTSSPVPLWVPHFNGQNAHNQMVH